MQNAPQSQPEAFEGQIEKSLNVRLNELREVDSTKHNQLNMKKREIIQAINQVDGAEDLRLSMGELRQVSATVGMDFEEFRDLLGIDLDEYVELDESMGTQTLFNTEFKFNMPIGMNAEMKGNFQECFARVEERNDLRRFLKKSAHYTEFEALGEDKIKFSVILDANSGEVGDYIATPTGVFRIAENESGRDSGEPTVMTAQIEGGTKREYFDASGIKLLEESVNKDGNQIRIELNPDNSMATIYADGEKVGEPYFDPGESVTFDGKKIKAGRHIYSIQPGGGMRHETIGS